jgi:uncharacterized protein
MNPLSTPLEITCDTESLAFEGNVLLGKGRLVDVAKLAKQAHDRHSEHSCPAAILVFAAGTSQVIDLDWRGSLDAFLARLAAPDDAPAKRSPGRPKLGVVAREVTLLPRHWDWLSSQTGGASVALRKLVEVARRASESKDRRRQASEVGYRFMSTMAGHEVGFEEASRALFAADLAAFEHHTQTWSKDVLGHLSMLLQEVFAPDDLSAYGSNASVTTEQS